MRRLGGANLRCFFGCLVSLLFKSRPISWRSAAIFCCIWLSIFALRSSWTVEDTIVSSTLIPNFVQGHGIDLSGIPFGLNIENPNDLCFFKDELGRVLPIHPVGMVVLSAPIQIFMWGAAWLIGAPLDVTTPEFLMTRIVVEKLAASFISGLSVVYLYQTLRLFVPASLAMAVAALYTFGSSSLSVLSQGLWPHTGINFILIYLTNFLLRHETPPAQKSEYLFWGALGILCGIRPTAIPFVGIFALVFIILFGRPRISSICVAGLALLPTISWNVILFQHVMGGYLHVKNKLFELWLPECLVRLRLILFSPHRGLLVFNPFLVFIPAAFGPLRELPRNRLIVLAALGACILSHYLLCSTNPEWHGGYTFGPRYMLDVLAPLFLFAGIGFSAMHSRFPTSAKTVFALIVILSTTIHLFGVLGDRVPFAELNGFYRGMLVP